MLDNGFRGYGCKLVDEPIKFNHAKRKYIKHVCMYVCMYIYIYMYNNYLTIIRSMYICIYMYMATPPTKKNMSTKILRNILSVMVGR